MILKKENRSNYTPFHYWAEGYRHNTINKLAKNRKQMPLSNVVCVMKPK